MAPFLRNGQLLAGAFASLLTLVCGFVWATDSFGRFDVTHFTVPVAPGRTFHVEVWTSVMVRDRSHGAYHSVISESLRTRQVGIWYQRGASGMPAYVATFPLPIWPLFAATAGAALVLSGVSAQKRRATLTLRRKDVARHTLVT